MEAGTSTEGDGIWVEAGEEPEVVVAVEDIAHPVESVLHTAREQVHDDVPPVPYTRAVILLVSPRLVLPSSPPLPCSPRCSAAPCCSPTLPPERQPGPRG